MMFPIGLSLVAHLTQGRESDKGSRDFSMAMMLMCAFGASIGAIGTPIGTPPNLIGIGMLNWITGADISFFECCWGCRSSCCCSACSMSSGSS